MATSLSLMLSYDDLHVQLRLIRMDLTKFDFMYRY